MRIITHVITALSLLIGFAGCENFFGAVVVLDAPEHTPRLVVHSIIDMEYPYYLTATVGFSRGVFEDAPAEELTIIKDASVELYRDNELYWTLDTLGFFNPSEYSALNYDDTLDIGQTYELRVSHPDYENVTAMQTIPAQIPLKGATYRPDGGVNQFGENVGAIEITIDDPIGEHYYEYSVLFVDTLDDGSLSYYEIYSETLDPSIEQGTNLIADRNFDGSQYTARLNYYNWDYVNEEPSNRAVFINWKTVTKEYFQYQSSLSKSLAAKENPLAEPVGLFTNINNGLGFFGARNGKIYEAEEQ